MENSLDIVAHTDVSTPDIDPADFDQLDKMPESFSISSEYLKFERPGDSQRVFWVGWTTFQSKQKDENTGLQKEIPAGVFLWRENANSGPKRVIHGGSNLVRQLENIGYPGQKMPLKITLMGKKKANTGNSFDEFEVVVLDGGKPNNTRTDQQKRNSENMNDNSDLHSDEPFGEKKPTLLPVNDVNRGAVSSLKTKIDEGYFKGDIGVERLKSAMISVSEQLAARNISKDFIKSKSPDQNTWSIFKTAVNIMVAYDWDAPIDETVAA